MADNTEALVKRLREHAERQRTYDPDDDSYSVLGNALREAATALESLAARPQTVTEEMVERACASFYAQRWQEWKRSDPSFARVARQNIRAALQSALAAAPPPVSQWQTMENAPKDGTHVLLAGPVYQMRADSKAVVDRTYREVGCFYRGEWTTRWMDGYDNPTLWQPLPDLPAPPTEQDKP